MGIRSSRSPETGAASNAGGGRDPRTTRPGPRRWAGILAGLVVAVVASGCDHDARPATGAKAVKVVVTPPITDTVIDYQDFTGRLDAVKTVDIRARVSGYVTQMPFKEGDRVKEGDLLFQIDPRPYQADFNQAEANLKVARGRRQPAGKERRACPKLILTQAIIARKNTTRRSRPWRRPIATVGAVEAARTGPSSISTTPTSVAPLSGRISRRFVDPGNLVNADNTILTTIVTEDPMYAYFDVDERTYLDLLDGRRRRPAARGHAGLRSSRC